MSGLRKRMNCLHWSLINIYWPSHVQSLWSCLQVRVEQGMHGTSWSLESKVPKQKFHSSDGSWLNALRKFAVKVTCEIVQIVVANLLKIWKRKETAPDFWNFCCNVYTRSKSAFLIVIHGPKMFKSHCLKRWVGFGDFPGGSVVKPPYF